jgi:dihydrofolate reductase
VIVFNDIDELLKKYKSKEIYVIGGKEIYELFFKLADKLIISRINCSYNCDTRLKFDMSDFKLTNKVEKRQFTIEYYSR